MWDVKVFLMLGMCVQKANIFWFISQFLFERVEGISRVTIIDLDAHQVSRYITSLHVNSHRCLAAIIDDKIAPLLLPEPPCRQIWPLPSDSAECILKRLRWQTAEWIQAYANSRMSSAMLGTLFVWAFFILWKMHPNHDKESLLIFF